MTVAALLDHSAAALAKADLGGRERTNGAGGSRTPVSRQSACRFYACIRRFDLGLGTAAGGIPFGPAVRVVSSASLKASLADQPDAYGPRRIGRLAGNVRPKLGRESVIAVGN